LALAIALTATGCFRLSFSKPDKEWQVEWIASDSATEPATEASSASYFAATLDPGGNQAAWLARKAEVASFDADRLEAEVFRLTNELRRQHKLSPLHYNPRLAAAGRSHSQEMASLGYISHNSPTPGCRTPEERLARAGLGFRISAENIAYEPCLARFWTDGRAEYFTWGQVAANAVRHWAESEGHRENLLMKDVRELGVGAAIATSQGRPYVYLTQNFRAP